MQFDHALERIAPNIVEMLTIGGAGISLPAGTTAERPNIADPGQ